MSDLKPCPFCGGSPVLDGKSDDVRVRCEDGCGALGPIFFFDGEDYEAIELASTAARESWNRRASPPAEAQEIERLRADVARTARTIEALAIERGMARATRDQTLQILSGIHLLLYPSDVTTTDGKTMRFTPKPEDANLFMHELSRRIRAIPDAIAAIDAALAGTKEE